MLLAILLVGIDHVVSGWLANMLLAGRGVV